MHERQRTHTCLASLRTLCSPSTLLSSTEIWGRTRTRAAPQQAGRQPQPHQGARASMRVQRPSTHLLLVPLNLHVPLSHLIQQLPQQQPHAARAVNRQPHLRATVHELGVRRHTLHNQRPLLIRVWAAWHTAQVSAVADAASALTGDTTAPQPPRWSRRHSDHTGTTRPPPSASTHRHCRAWVRGTSRTWRRHRSPVLSRRWPCTCHRRRPEATPRERPPGTGTSVTNAHGTTRLWKTHTRGAGAGAATTMHTRGGGVPGPAAWLLRSPRLTTRARHP